MRVLCEPERITLCNVRYCIGGRVDIVQYFFENAVNMSVVYIQGVSGGIVNILGSGSMDYSE